MPILIPSPNPPIRKARLNPSIRVHHVAPIHDTGGEVVDETTSWASSAGDDVEHEEVMALGLFRVF